MPQEAPHDRARTPQVQKPAGAASSDTISDVIERLASRNAAATRYQIRGEVARGGMGAILRIWDEDLRRDLAMKVILGADGAPVSTTRGGADPRLVSRFLDEAQVTGQLDHPGIVPVHELGQDDQGRIYFTMRLVAGRDLEKIFGLVANEEEGWTRTRAVGAILKICEALAYAHEKGVIHRDLKPANVMVGKFGEVYVMDWGVARVLGRDEIEEAPLAGAPLGARGNSVSVSRRGPTGTAVAQATMEGDIVGTPTYMSPEQARGDLQATGPASDIYAVGAILYRLLAGHPPHTPPGSSRDAIEVWRRAKHGQPEPLSERAPDAPAELVAICEKAMAREIADRYPSMLHFADDLRAYLEGRVVRAYETGAIAEFKKWVLRNKTLAATVASALAIIVLGSTIAALVLARKNEELSVSEKLANANAVTAQKNAAIAEDRASKILRLSDVKRLNEMQALAQTLWPARPDMVERYKAWLSDAKQLADRLPEHRRALEEIRSRAKPGTSWDFASPEDGWQHEVQQELVEHLASFGEPEHGAIAAVEKRLEFASTVEELTVSGERARARWAEAIAAIADTKVCPKYGGLKVSAQLGLLPIGRDPKSGLYEFAYLASGDEPSRDAHSGALELTDSSCIVFVLLPGGTFTMGAQARRPNDPNYDPLALENEYPPTEITLAPFFLSKYEMTQGQWLRATGNNPSLYGPGVIFGGVTQTLLDPVEQVTWPECTAMLHDLGLELPTEAQWEYGARAGKSTPWSTGADRETLEGSANLYDQTAQREKSNGVSPEDWLDDGFTIDAPVDALMPNSFGLHHMHGNVFEWCRDPYDPANDGPVDGPDALRVNGQERLRVNRGGSFRHGAEFARSSYRNASSPETRFNNLGLRAARPLDP